MIVLDPTLALSLPAPEQDLALQAAEQPSPARPVAPAKTAFDASLEPLLQELDVAEANAGGIQDDEEPVAPPSEDEDASFPSIAQVWDSFMVACARPEQLPREAEPETPKARAHEALRGGCDVAVALPPPEEASSNRVLDGDARPAIDATDEATVDAARAAPIEEPAPPALGRSRPEPALRERTQASEVLASPARTKPAVEAPPPPERPLSRVRSGSRERARPIEPPPAARERARPIEPPPAARERARPIEPPPAARERAQPIEPPPAARDPSSKDAAAQEKVQAAPAFAAEKAAKWTPVSRRPTATVAQENTDVGGRPPVADRLLVSDREVAVPLIGEVVRPATDDGSPTATARIPSRVTDLTLTHEAGGSIEHAVRAAETAGHRRALATEARGRIVAPALGPVEVVARLEPDARVAVVVHADEQHGRDAIEAARLELVAHVRAEVPRADVHVKGAAATSAGAFAGEGRDGGREAPPREPPEEGRSPSFAPARRPRARFVL
jgi:hypothetical protein